MLTGTLTHHPLLQVTCIAAGPLTEAALFSSSPLPSELEWGQVLVKMSYAPIDAADSYVSMTGGSYGESSTSLPYTGGQHGLGSVMMVFHFLMHADFSLQHKNTATINLTVSE